MLFLVNDIEDMACIAIQDENDCINSIYSAYFVYKNNFIKDLYKLLLNYPKFIIEDTIRHREHYFVKSNVIGIECSTIEELYTILAKYKDDYYIISDINYYRGSILIDLYHIKDFLYKNKITSYLREFIIDEILKDLQSC